LPWGITIAQPTPTLTAQNHDPRIKRNHASLASPLLFRPARAFASSAGASIESCQPFLMAACERAPHRCPSFTSTFEFHHPSRAARPQRAPAKSRCFSRITLVRHPDRRIGIFGGGHDIGRAPSDRRCGFLACVPPRTARSSNLSVKRTCSYHRQKSSSDGIAAVGSFEQMGQQQLLTPDSGLATGRQHGTGSLRRPVAAVKSPARLPISASFALDESYRHRLLYVHARGGYLNPCPPTRSLKGHRPCWGPRNLFDYNPIATDDLVVSCNQGNFSRNEHSRASSLRTARRT